MRRDFTLTAYSLLLSNLSQTGYHFSTVRAAGENSANYQKIVILRHDVDKQPGNAYLTAELERAMNVTGTYYFRIVPESFDTEIIQAIESMGHEIGYHYEDVALAAEILSPKYGRSADKNILIERAHDLFLEHLSMMRKIADVKTLCMHGSPLSQYDNRMLWEKYDYKNYGLEIEPYFDFDFSETAYFTDTGRRWNSKRTSARDKVQSVYNFNFRSTWSLIDNLEKLPDKIMLTVHPQRWTDSYAGWGTEYILQNIKNSAKFVINLMRQ